MNIKLVDKKIKDIQSDLELVLIVDGNMDHKWVKDKEYLEKLNFKSEEGNIELLVTKARIYAAIDSLNPESLRIVTAKVAMFLSSKNFKNLKLGLYASVDVSAEIRAIVEGFILGSYSFDKYRSREEKRSLKNIIISTEVFQKKNIDPKTLKDAVKEASIIAESTNYVRDLVNQTPADIDPLVMTNLAKDLAKDSKIKVKAFGDKYLKENGMGAMLAVSRASEHPAQLIHLTYVHRAAKKKVVLVGKGLTYDTGGLSLKPSEGMLDMKMDKAGACAIYGVIKAVEALALPIELHVIVGAVENAIGKHAYKPGDVLKAMNGKTIEVKNTDAEGRLVLADCLCYGQKLFPDYIIDIATLTGACIVALGEYTIGVMGHEQKLISELRDCGSRSGELNAELPFNRYLPALLKSDIADISNMSSGKWGGAITAGLFLSNFIEDKNKNKWLHLDIAGPAFASKAWGENPSGATGAGVRTLIEWLKNITRSK